MNKTMTKLWLDYARDILVDPNGRRRPCCLQSRQSVHQILWPGYVGERFRKGGILFVGAVHNEMKLYNGAQNRMRALETFALGWASRRAGVKDGAYLKMLRGAYQKAAPSWSDRFASPYDPPRSVWGAFFRLMRALNLGFDEIAFTNLAKCKLRSPDSRDPIAVQQSRADYIKAVCSCRNDSIKMLPLSVLKPRAIFIECGQRALVNAALIALGNKVVHLRVFDQPSARTKCASKHPDTKPWEEWVRDDVKSLGSS